MFYLKQQDFFGKFSLPIVIPTMNPKINQIIEQEEKEMFTYIMGELGKLMYADLDISGNPQTARFIQLNPYVYPAILRLTYCRIAKHFDNTPTPQGNVSPDKSPSANIALDSIWDEGIYYAEELRKYISENSLVYPEFCLCNCKSLRKSII
jgi:hypothetical protein